MKSDITCIARTTLLVVVAGLGSAACGGDEPPSNDSQSGAGAATTQNGSGGGGVGGTGTGGLATGGAGGVGGAAPDLAHKVSVVDQKGEPLANVNLVINDAGGALVGHVKTDALGQAEVEIPEAGSVSALYSQDLSFQIWSVHDIPAKQAVSITVYVYGDPPPPPSDAPTTYEFSICSTPPGTTLVHADNNCDGAFLGPTSPLPLKTDNANCIDDPTQDLIFTASDGDLNAKGWATALGLSTIPGTVVTGQACMTNTTVQSAALSLGDLPASVDEVSFQVYTRLGKASYRNYTHPEPSGGDASSTRTVPSIPGATYEMTLYASSGDNIERSFFNYTLKDEAQLSHVQLTLDDFGWVTAGPVNVASPERPSTTWITSQQPAGDYARLFMSWYTGSATYELNVALAPDHQHSFQFPELPDELADFRPAATSVIRWGVIYEDWPNVNAYAEIVGGATKEAVAGVGDVAVGSTSSK